ncbi:hypothetical protein MBLNU230_g3901t1 [Neophaeotheca triangularis]
MTVPRTALTPLFYTKWLTLFSPSCPSCPSCLNRGISTTSAINKGLRASRDSGRGRSKPMRREDARLPRREKRALLSEPNDEAERQNPSQKQSASQIATGNHLKKPRREGLRIVRQVSESSGDAFAGPPSPHRQPRDSDPETPRALVEEAPMPVDPEELANELSDHVVTLHDSEVEGSLDNSGLQLHINRARKMVKWVNKNHHSNVSFHRYLKQHMPSRVYRRTEDRPLGAYTVLWTTGNGKYELLTSHLHGSFRMHNRAVDRKPKFIPQRSREHDEKNASERIVRMIEKMMKERLPPGGSRQPDSRVDMADQTQALDRDLIWLKKRAEAEGTELSDLKRDVAKLTEALQVSEREKKEQQQKAASVEPSQVSDDDADGHPVSIPYSTASSQFLYGTNTVLAALRAGRRKLYALHTARQFRDGPVSPARDEMLQLARKHKIPIRPNQSVRLLNAMSGDRPHNNFVLEASGLPSPPVLSLGKHNQKHAIIPLRLCPQSAEEISINGAPSALPASSGANRWRYPLVLFLDGITDPGNLGNILRTAHFYSVDAVVVATNTCAPLSSAVVAKASAGACEALTILGAPKPSGFIYDSQKVGQWKVYASVAPPDPNFMTTSKAGKHVTSEVLSKDSPLAKDPCILMLGAEGEGLREIMLRRADREVSVIGGPSKPVANKWGDSSNRRQNEVTGEKGRPVEVVDVGVESLNVGVAAGVLLDCFMRKPEGLAKRQEKEKLW